MFARRFAISVCLCIRLLFAFAPQPMGAQTVTTGEVTGAASDTTGAMVASAVVTLKSVDTGETRTVVSSSAGLYRFPFVRPGSYELSASSAGLRSDVVRVAVGLGQVQALNLVMKIEEPKQSVEVTAASPLLDTDNAQTIYTLSQRQIEQLPLPGGDLVGVAYSAPGAVIANRYGTNGNFVLQGVGGVSNIYTVNGADDMNTYWNLNNYGVSGMLLGVNEIQEASVIQNAYEGQYGRNAGTQVNYVSKSGTNAHHGNLTYGYNGSVLNANDYFNNQVGLKRPHEVSNQYAASFGGPVVRDKLFFFVDTEGLRYATPGNTAVLGVPSKALEQYSLNRLQPSQLTLYKQVFSLYEAAPGRSHGVAVTNGTGPLQDSSGRLGCGALAGTKTGFGGTFGTDVSCVDAYATTVAKQTSEWLMSARVDYNLSARQRMFARFKTDHGSLPVNTSAISPAFNVVSHQPDYEGQLNHTFTITPRLANNLTASGSWNSYVSTFANQAAALEAFPLRFNIGDGGSNSSAGLTALGAPAANPTGQRGAQMQFVDDISYSIGNHSLKAGINYRYNQEADLMYSALSLFGRYNFLGLDEFATGVLNPDTGSNFGQRFPTTPVLHVRMHNIGFYGQDQWAVTPHLRLTGTLRFDRSGNPDCIDRCFARFAVPFADMAKGAAIPYNQSIRTGLSSAFDGTDAVTVQPRFSFAYNPGWSKDTVIRGGVGLFSDLYPMFFVSTLAGNPPEVFFPIIRTGLVNSGGPGSSVAIVAASANAFESSFASGATLAQLQKAVAPATFAAPFYYSTSPQLHMPKFLEWSAEIQHQIGRRNVASVCYAGNHGYDLFFTNGWLNASVNAANYPNGFGGLPTSTPDPRFASVQELTNAGYSNHNGMTATLRRAFGSGLQGQISYTWSHTLDLLSDGGILPFAYDSFLGQFDPKNPRSLNYADSDYDVRHNLTFDFVWDTPKFHNRALRTVLGGWTMSGKGNAFTGVPFSVYNNRLGGRVGVNGGSVILASVLDPTVRTTCDYSAVRTPCFTQSQFYSLTTQTNFGNVGRNHFRGPGYFDVDTSLSKTIVVRERTRFTVGATALNLFNHPNFADPQQNVASSSLGLITFNGTPPSGPYGWFGGPSGRAVVLTGKLSF